MRGTIPDIGVGWLSLSLYSFSFLYSFSIYTLYHLYTVQFYNSLTVIDVNRLYIRIVLHSFL